MVREQPASRRPSVLAAGPAPELSRLGIAQLRAYRAALHAEEDKVSYWRRLLQGRVDLLEADLTTGHPVSRDALVRALGDTGTGRSRHMLMAVSAPLPLPDLPDLEELGPMWEAAPEDPTEIAGLVESLRAKEEVLSEYRRALHQRIDAATGELIVRYRQDPTAVLDLMPRE